MFSSSALENVSQCCLISCMLLHIFHTFRPVCLLSPFSSIYHIDSSSTTKQIWLHICLYQRKHMCKVHPLSLSSSLSSSLASFLHASEHHWFIVQFIMNIMLKSCHIGITFLETLSIRTPRKISEILFITSNSQALVLKISLHFAVTYTCCCRKKIRAYSWHI